jgi:hypothetical protein
MQDSYPLKLDSQGSKYTMITTVFSVQLLIYFLMSWPAWSIKTDIQGFQVVFIKEDDFHVSTPYDFEYSL